MMAGYPRLLNTGKIESMERFCVMTCYDILEKRQTNGLFPGRG